MPGPTFMSSEMRGTSGNAIARLVRGGTFAELLGSTGVMGPRDTTSNGINRFQRSTFARYKGLIYCSCFDGVYVLNPITNLWVQARSFAFGLGPLAGSPSDLVVVDTPSGSYLVTVWSVATGSGNRADVWERYDGTSWVRYQVTPGWNSSEASLFVHKGIVYGKRNTPNNTMRVMSYDPVTNVGALVTWTTNDAPLLTTASFVYFSLDDRLFVLMNSNNAVVSRMYEFKFGAWVRITPSGIPTLDTTNGDYDVIKIGDDVFMLGPDNVTTALVCYKINVAAPGAVPTMTALTAPVPSVLRAGTTVGSPDNYRVHGFVDTFTTPGSPVGYFMFWPDETVSAIPTLFRWNDEATEMSVAASPQILGSSGAPRNQYGGGESMNGLSTSTSPLVTTSPEGNSQGANGVQIDFSAEGDPVVVVHDGSGPNFTTGLVVTQTPSGATGTIDRLDNGLNTLHLRGVTGTFVAGQTITDTGTGSGVQVGASTGGASDKTVTARYHLSGLVGIGVPSTGICTIVPGSVVDGEGGPAVESGNSIINVTADGRSFSFEWDFFADGVPEGLIDNIELFISRP